MVKFGNLSVKRETDVSNLMDIISKSDIGFLESLFLINKKH